MRPRELAGVLAVVLATTVGPISGQEEHLEILRGKLQVELEEIVAAYEGVAGLHVVDLTSGDRFTVNDDLIFPQASSIKIPILLELFRRAESDPEILRKRVVMGDDVRTGGSGVLRVLTDGGSALSLASQHEPGVWMSRQHPRHGANQKLVPLDREKIGNDRDTRTACSPPTDGAGTARISGHAVVIVHIHPVLDHAQPRVRHPNSGTCEQVVRHILRWRDDTVAAAIDSPKHA